MNDLIERLNMLASRMMATTLFGKDAHTVLEASCVLKAIRPEATPAEDALNLLLEMNDALCVPYGWQKRVDAILDRVDEILERTQLNPD